MYLYGDDFKVVAAWNAVNVPDKDGVLRHGSVIGVKDGGLIIDFECPNQRSEVVQFGSIFDVAGLPSAISRDSYYSDEDMKNGSTSDHGSDDSSDNSSDESSDDGSSNGSKDEGFTKGADIEALVRLRPVRPWTWLPGTLVALEPRSTSLAYAVVEMSMEGSIVQELIPCAQVRRALSSSQLDKAIIGDDVFVTRSCPLPKNYWASISSILSCVLNRDLKRKYNVLTVSVFSDSLLYLQRRSRQPIQPEQLDHLYKQSKAEVTRHSNSQNHPHREWLLRHILTKPSSKKRQSLPDHQGARLQTPLPVEILVEIFHYLGTITRLRCRRICTVWNAILTAPHMRQHVVVSLTEDSFLSSPYDFYWSPLYAVTGCVLKCIDTSTRCLAIISDQDEHTCSQLNSLEYVGRAMQGSRMERLILHNVAYEVRYGYGDDEKSMADALVHLVNNCSCCHILTIHDSTFRFVVDRYRSKPSTDEFEVYISCGSVKMSAPDAVSQLWDLLEKNCGEKRIPEEELRWCAEWVKSQQSSPDAIEVLNALQSVDPRNTTHYRGKEWTAENVSELDVAKLNRITLRALYAVKSRGQRMTKAYLKSSPAGSRDCRDF